MAAGALLAIERARIPGLLCSRLAETGEAALLAGEKAAAVRFGEDSSRLTASFRAAGSLPEEALDYVKTAAGTCGMAVEAREDGIWISAAVSRNAGLKDEVGEICRLAREIIGGAIWLERDQSARTVWAGLARPAGSVRKGDDIHEGTDCSEHGGREHGRS